MLEIGQMNSALIESYHGKIQFLLYIHDPNATEETSSMWYRVAKLYGQQLS
jgi:hypothetical protein